MASNPPSERTFAQKVFVTVGIVFLAALFLALVYFTIDILLLIFSAILIAIFLRGLAIPISVRFGFAEGWAVLGVSAVLVLILLGAVALLTPSVAEQIQILRIKLPESARQASDYVATFSWGQALIRQMPSADSVMEKIDTAKLITGVGGVFSSTVGAIGNFFIVILLAVYLAAEPRVYSSGIVRLFPLTSRARASEVFESMGETLRWWLIGKIGSMVFIGVLTWIGLSIIGVPLALTLGLIAGLLSFIPNFGPIISALPALLLAFINSPVTVLYVLGLYVGVQLIESNLVTPFIERKTVELPPALTIVFQLIFGVMLGALGLVLATPLLAVVMVAVQMVYLEDVLLDRGGKGGPEPSDPGEVFEVED